VRREEENRKRKKAIRIRAGPKDGLAAAVAPRAKGNVIMLK